MDDWVSATTDDVYEKVHGGPRGQAATHQLDDEDLWNEFAQEFANAFANTALAEHAYAELTKLSMKGKEADQYIATFERLIQRAGWDRTAHGSIEYFKKGLPRKLMFTILNRDQTPVTINKWQQVLRNEIQCKNMISASLGDRVDNVPFKPQWKPTRRQRHWDPDAIDVDAMITEGQSKEIKKLTLAEKQKHIQEGRCFTYGHLGHMSQACPKKEGKNKKDTLQCVLRSTPIFLFPLNCHYHHASSTSTSTSTSSATSTHSHANST